MAKPEQPRSMVGNAGVLFVGRLVVAALGWAGTILIIRRLSVDEWGRFSFVFSFLGLMLIVTNVVNARQAIRGFYDAEEPSDFVGVYIALRLALGLIGYPLALAFVIIAGYPHQVVEVTAAAGLVVIIATPSTGYHAVFEASMDLRPIAVASVLGQVAQFLLTVFLVVHHASIVVLTIPAVVFEVVSLAWKLRAVRRLVRLRLRFAVRQWLHLLRLGVPYAIGAALSTLYYSIDTVMLSKMDTFRSVGVYNIAYKFAGVLEFLPAAVMSSVLARLVRNWPDDPPAFWAAFNKAVVLLALCSALVIAGFLIFAAPAIRLLYGPGYVAASNATRLVTASQCVGFFTALGVTTLVALNRNVMYPLAALVGVAVNVGINLFVIPRWSYNGAAWATLTTEVVVVTLLWATIIGAEGRPRLPRITLLKVAGAGIAAAALAYPLRHVLPWEVAAAVLLVTYTFIVHVGRIPGPDGLRSLFTDEVPEPSA
jgi:O-antigen/teichoic acid export membrane protein